MKIRYAARYTAPLIWLIPLALHSGDALAWGLYTHVYFAQLLLWAVPLADPRFRRAVRRFPDLLLAGACLPDVSLFSNWVRSEPLGQTHHWAMAQQMLQGAQDDSEAALATGYCCHLLADIVAHNYFVPAHETLWLNPSHLTVHAASEWAMDAHLAPQLFVRPGRLLQRHLPAITRFASRHFAAPPRQARIALHAMMFGERLLRHCGAHQLAYRVARATDTGAVKRFDDYADQTAQRMEQMNRLIAGDAPSWAPEVDSTEGARERYVGTAGRGHLSLLLPRDFFVGSERSRY